MKNSISQGLRLGQKVSKGFRKWLKDKMGKCVNCAKSVMQIFKLTKLTKLTEQIFATYATYASANFVGKESSESTEMYRVKSRITTTCLRLASVFTSTRIRLASLICLCMLTVGSGNAWGDVTDEITVGDLAATNTTYTNFSNHAETSSARYAGNTAKGNSVIQLRASSNCGIVSTTSGGVIKSVTITWNGKTTDGRVIEVYGSNTAYSGSSDLYDSSKKGVLLGTIAKNVTTPLSVVGDFKYIGLKSNGTNTFITKFSITWTDADDPLDYVYNLVTDVSDLAAGDRVIILNTGGTYAMSTTQNTNNRAGVAAAANNWSISGNTVTLGASTTVEVMTIGVQNSHKVFVTSTGYLRAANSSTNYYLKTNLSVDSYCEWTISLNGSYEASIVGCGDNTNKTMRFNSNLFACYASASYTAIKIYKQEPPSYTVTWAAGSEEEFYTQTDVAGTALEDPGTPTAGTYCPGGKVFVGWTETPIAGEDDDAPADLFTSVSGMSIPEGGATYYAVFATSSGSGGTEYVLTDADDLTAGTYVIASYNTTTSKYVALTGGITTNKGNSDLTNETTGFTISDSKFTTLPTGACEFTLTGNTSDGFTIQNGSSKYLGYTEYSTNRKLAFGDDYSSYTWKADDLTYSGYPDGCYIERGITNNYKISTNSDNTATQVRGYPSSTFKPIYFFKKGSGTSYSAYATSCGPSCAEPTAASAGSFNSGTQKMPISWTSAAGKVDICYSTSSTKPDATPSASYTVVSNQTSSPVNLDVSGLSAGNYYCWVRSVCDEDSKSSWTAITGDYFTIPGYTLTISPDPASSGTFDQTSGQTVVVGRTVSITATPAAGYNFTSWAVSGTGSSLSSTSTNPTTFTMGTANATVTATFTAKTLSSISLDETAVTIYDQQYTQIGVTYDPSDILTKGYTLVASPTKVVTTGSTNAQLKISATKAGVTITSQETETVSIKANADNTKTASVTVTINPLPKVHFVDLVHGKEFSDVAGTISANVLVSSKTTPTSDDWDSTYKNDCEEDHVHLVGWIRSDWPDLIAYLAGTGDLPETDDITGAGNDGSGNAYYFTAGASINVLTFDGKTFYAVWAKAE